MPMTREKRKTEKKSRFYIAFMANFPEPVDFTNKFQQNVPVRKMVIPNRKIP